VVATISLGSHTVFHYLRYKPDSEEERDESTEVDQPLSSVGATESESRESSNPERLDDKMMSKGGRAIDPKPVLSLLLEPRSVIITSGRLYEGFLHWIEEVERDEICAISEAKTERDNGEDWRRKVKIDNWEDIRGGKERAVLETGGALERGTRVSLTCRDVEKVKRALMIGRR
jgi:alkylated DNA repair protein alkB homolog 6